MEKLKSTLPNMLLSLTIICVGAGAILAAVNRMTAAPIAASKSAALQEAIKKVTPDFDNDPVAELFYASTSEGDSLKIYPAKKGEEMIGVAVESYTKKGFSGEILIIVGFTPSGEIFNYSVLQHAETPGLGSKMDAWFREEKNNQSVIGRNLSTGDLQVSKDGGEVDAITASTISSRAFLDAVNRAYHAYKGTDAATGATEKSEQ